MESITLYALNVQLVTHFIQVGLHLCFLNIMTFFKWAISLIRSHDCYWITMLVIHIRNYNIAYRKINMALAVVIEIKHDGPAAYILVDQNHRLIQTVLWRLFSKELMNPMLSLTFYYFALFCNLMLVFWVTTIITQISMLF